MGCCTSNTQVGLKKFETQASRLEEMKSNIFDGNEDGYYDVSELKQNMYKKLVTLAEEQPAPKLFSWTTGQLIGQGSFGRVYQAMNKETGQIMAVKQVLITQDDEKLSQLEIEIELLSLLKHRNIVSYYGMAKNAKTINIFLEYVAGGSLTSIIQKFGKLNENLIKSYLRQILEGLDYLHSHGIMHRDIKGGNVLVDSNGICKLADFGSSQRLSKLLNQQLSGTPNYMAPEVVLQANVGRKSDIWSLGCTMIEMATSKPPLHDVPNQFAVMIKIGKGYQPPIPENLSEDAKDFLSHCLEADPIKRWNARKLLQHSFLKNKLDTPLRINPARTPNKTLNTPLKGTPGEKKGSQKFNYNPNTQLTSNESPANDNSPKNIVQVPSRIMDDPSDISSHNLIPQHSPKASKLWESPEN